MVRRTIKEVLEEFRSVRIPLDYIFDVFPPLRPREFSIASSVKVLSVPSTVIDPGSEETPRAARRKYTYALL